MQKRALRHNKRLIEESVKYKVTQKEFANKKPIRDGSTERVNGESVRILNLGNSTETSSVRKVNKQRTISQSR